MTQAETSGLRRIEALKNQAVAGDLPDPGPRPQLFWLPVESLRIDPAYQREIDQGGRKNILRIVDAFAWRKFAPVIVARGEGGVYHVIDGQHRTTAALMRGIAEVPCMVIEGAQPRDCAEIFAAVNGTVTQLKIHALYRAALKGGIAWATAIDRCCKATGWEAMAYNVSRAKMTKPRQIAAIGTLRKIVERQGEEKLLAILSLLAAVADHRQEIEDLLRQGHRKTYIAATLRVPYAAIDVVARQIEAGA